MDPCSSSPVIFVNVSKAIQFIHMPKNKQTNKTPQSNHQTLLQKLNQSR